MFLYNIPTLYDYKVILNGENKINFNTYLYTAVQAVEEVQFGQQGALEWWWRRVLPRVGATVAPPLLQTPYLLRAAALRDRGTFCVSYRRRRRRRSRYNTWQ